MILLGVNCGFGNGDCGTLPVSALDLDGAWVNYPRPKTAIQRRCPLWPETVWRCGPGLPFAPNRRAKRTRACCSLPSTARVGIKTRPTIPSQKKCGSCWMSWASTGRASVSTRWRDMTETVGGGCKDQVAVNALMGHVDSTMAGATAKRSRMRGCEPLRIIFVRGCSGRKLSQSLIISQEGLVSQQTDC